MTEQIVAVRYRDIGCDQTEMYTAEELLHRKGVEFVIFGMLQGEHRREGGDRAGTVRERELPRRHHDPAPARARGGSHRTVAAEEEAAAAGTLGPRRRAGFVCKPHRRTGGAGFSFRASLDASAAGICVTRVDAPRARPYTRSVTAAPAVCLRLSHRPVDMAARRVYNPPIFLDRPICAGLGPDQILAATAVSEAHGSARSAATTAGAIVVGASA